MKHLLLLRALPALVLAPLLVACGGGAPSPAHPEPSGEGGGRDVAAIHRARCGSCHERVEPGARTRQAFETALARHHQRVKMTDDEWRRMIDFLAADGRVTPSASPPPQAAPPAPPASSPTPTP